MAKQVFNGRKTVFKVKIEIPIRKRLIQTYIWRLYGCGTLTQKDKKKFAVLKICYWKRTKYINKEDRKEMSRSIRKGS